MRNNLVATRAVLAAAAGAVLTVLSLGGCQSTPPTPPDQPIAHHPGPHSGADGKDTGSAVGNPGPHS